MSALPGPMTPTKTTTIKTSAGDSLYAEEFVPAGEPNGVVLARLWAAAEDCEDHE